MSLNTTSGDREARERYSTISRQLRDESPQVYAYINNQLDTPEEFGIDPRHTMEYPLSVWDDMIKNEYDAAITDMGQ